MDNITIAFLITLFAGVATGIGSAIAYLAHKLNRWLISFALGLSAGVMIYISFVELLPHAQEQLTLTFGQTPDAIYATLAFFGGIATIALIDFLVPQYENPHEPRTPQSSPDSSQQQKRLGIMAAIAIAIHNFPEGISTFVTALEDPSMGLAIGIAIALHNIPEGIAVSVPIYLSTQSKGKAFWYSMLSGLAEPLGAVLAYLFLMQYVNEQLISLILAAVGGIMVYVSIDELLPAAREYGKHHASIVGVIAGMAIMAATLILL